MKYFLFLAAVSGFLPVLTPRGNREGAISCSQTTSAASDSGWSFDDAQRPQCGEECSEEHLAERKVVPQDNAFEEMTSTQQTLEDLLQHEAALKTLLTESTAVQEEIVNLHNTIRRKVLPEASNMQKMSWGEDAAENARTVSKYCDTEGSDPIDRRLENTFCGENIYMSALPYSWPQVIGIWYSESKNFSYGKYVSQDLVITHHYTQLIWASSYLIGCGVTVCRKEKLFYYLYVCHYCHEGNDPERIYLPYKKGTPCGDCPTHCDDKLCTNPCLFYDELTNCETRVRALGCSHSSLKLLCNATCNCDTEIK